MTGNLIIRNARLLTATGLSEPRSIAVVGGVISRQAHPDTAEFDAAGGALLPGFIDSHAHVESERHLAECARWGVTTVLDMAAADWPTVDALRHRAGPHTRPLGDSQSESLMAAAASFEGAKASLSTLQSAGYPACAPRGTAVRKMGFPKSSVVTGPEDAERFVAERQAQGVDYMKIILDEKILPFQPRPLSALTVAALTAAAHSAGLLVVVHATSQKSFAVAARAGADVVTHMPLATALNRAQASEHARSAITVCPTMVMMKAIIENFPAPIKPRRIRYENIRSGVAALHAAGVRLVAGTDANSTPAAPAGVPHGSSLHEELTLLVEAGLSPLQALASATSTPSDVFGLGDRGRLSVGQRADLLLVDGDPPRDITATSRIQQVWIAGRPVVADSSI